ncbi:MAG: hypothetical protein EZS28_035037, partial [Streblomastix strix]
WTLWTENDADRFLRGRTVRRASDRSQTTRESSHRLGDAQKAAETQYPQVQQMLAFDQVLADLKTKLWQQYKLLQGTLTQIVKQDQLATMKFNLCAYINMNGMIFQVKLIRALSDTKGQGNLINKQPSQVIRAEQTRDNVTRLGSGLSNKTLYRNPTYSLFTASESDTTSQFVLGVTDTVPIANRAIPGNSANEHFLSNKELVAEAHKLTSTVINCGSNKTKTGATKHLQKNGYRPSNTISGSFGTRTPCNLNNNTNRRVDKYAHLQSHLYPLNTYSRIIEYDYYLKQQKESNRVRVSD